MHEVNFPMWCSLNIIGKLSPSSSILKVDGLCSVRKESSEFSLASPTEFEIYRYIEPSVIKSELYTVRTYIHT